MRSEKPVIGNWALLEIIVIDHKNINLQRFIKNLVLF